MKCLLVGLPSCRLLIFLLIWLASPFHTRSFTSTTTSSSRMPPDENFRLGYVTDVEGNLDYFLRYVEESSVLQLHEPQCASQSIRLDLVGSDPYFVFGGDAVDKGPGDIRLARALVDLKQRHPDCPRVFVGGKPGFEQVAIGGRARRG